jgi:hypothetical integral membrane protein (TIGR02206 family)
LKLFSGEHLWTLGAIALVAAAYCLAAWRWPGAWVDRAAIVLGAVILAAEGSWWLIWLPLTGNWSPSYGLPLQLCDVVGFLAPFALWFRRALLVELTYFWGLGGSLQALLTPDLKEHFPTYPYWQFYVAHGGVVIAGLALVIALGSRPRPRSIPRMFIITAAFAALVASVDVLTGGNYMFLRQKPLHGSLLDYMGPWPWYVASGVVLTLIFLTILDAPFWPGRRGLRRPLMPMPRRSGAGPAARTSG